MKPHLRLVRPSLLPQPPRARALALAALLLALPACGGGGNGGNVVETPTALSSLDPALGATTGGQTVTIQGEGFTSNDPGLPEVRFGTLLATAVTVLSDTELLATTPPATAGTVDVSVENDNGLAVLADAFTFGPPPAVSGVGSNYTRSDVAAGPTTGGTRILVAGSGFLAAGAGTPEVRVGGALATDVDVLNDAQLLATTAPNDADVHAVTVATAFGTGSLAGGFVQEALRLYAAEGKGNANGRLMLLNPNTGAPGFIGAGTGFSIDGLAMSRQGVLLAVTRVASPATSQLLTIDVFTGLGTVVADLRTDTNARVDMVDIEFVGDTLYGFAQNFRRPASIDTVTGLVTLEEFVDFGAGEAIFANNLLDVFLLPENSDENVWEFDRFFGDSAVLVALTGGSFVNGFYNSATFLNGVGFAVESARNGSNTEPGAGSALRSINPVTGASLQIGALPDDVDAVAGNFK
jgi:hypothetical protein